MAKTFNARVKNKYVDISEYQASNIVLLEGEIAFVKNGEDKELYVGDGVTPFNTLQPLFSTKYIVGIDRMNLEVVQLQPSDWSTDNEQVKEVKGVSADEQSQLVLVTYSQGSRQACQTAGLDYYVTNDAKLAFTCVQKPTEVLTVYVSIFGAHDDGQDDKPIIRTDIDNNFSLTSENPLQNKVITQKIDSIEATIRGITGEDGSGEETSIPALVEKLNTMTTYSNTPVVSGTWKNDDGSSEAVNKVKIPFTLAVNRDNLNGEMDLSCFTIPGTNVTANNLVNGYWTGKASTGEFFGSCPIIINTTGVVDILSVPVKDDEYTLTGQIIVEYTA